MITSDTSSYAQLIATQISTGQTYHTEPENPITTKIKLYILSKIEQNEFSFTSQLSKEDPKPNNAPTLRKNIRWNQEANKTEKEPTKEDYAWGNDFIKFVREELEKQSSRTASESTPSVTSKNCWHSSNPTIAEDKEECLGGEEFEKVTGPEVAPESGGCIIS